MVIVAEASAAVADAITSAEAPRVGRASLPNFFIPASLRADGMGDENDLRNGLGPGRPGDRGHWDRIMNDGVYQAVPTGR
ncbi:hypothetical protein GCM10022214_61600 [Actinomadura miaoliensis]|uniref:Uncharacterized protein n=1 Tax=Actinomadura miaoliensis TaxID=430685 RepID=A0ABP7WMI2_9ACTN